MKGHSNAQKNIVPFAGHRMLNVMAKPDKTSSGFDAMIVQRLLFGKNRITRSTVKNTGLNSGSPKVTQSGNLQNYPVTVRPKSSGLFTGTLIKSHLILRRTTTAKANIYYLTAPTSTRADALRFSWMPSEGAFWITGTFLEKIMRTFFRVLSNLKLRALIPAPLPSTGIGWWSEPYEKPGRQSRSSVACSISRTRALCGSVTGQKQRLAVCCEWF